MPFALRNDTCDTRTFVPIKVPISVQGCGAVKMPAIIPLAFRGYARNVRLRLPREHTSMWTRRMRVHTYVHQIILFIPSFRIAGKRLPVRFCQDCWLEFPN